MAFLFLHHDHSVFLHLRASGWKRPECSHYIGPKWETITRSFAGFVIVIISQQINLDIWRTWAWMMPMLILCFKSALDMPNDAMDELLLLQSVRPPWARWMKAQSRVKDCCVAQGNPANCILTISKSNLFTSPLVMCMAIRPILCYYTTITPCGICPLL